MPGHTPKNLSFFLQDCAKKFSDRTVLQIKRNGRYEKLAYQELLEKSKKLSFGLYQLGVRKADRVAIVSENSPEWVIAFFAVLNLGAVVVPLDSKLSEKELVHLLNHCEPSVIFCNPSLKYTFLNSSQILNFAPHFVAMRDDNKKEEDGAAGIDVQTLMEKNGEDVFVDVNQHDLAVVIYTSGTTGNPKGAMLSHGNMLYYPCLMARDDFFLKKDERILMMLPFHHVYPINVMLTEFAKGAVIILLRDLKPSEIFSTLSENKISGMAGVPRLYELFYKGILEKTSEFRSFYMSLFQKMRALSRASQGVFGFSVSKLLFMRVHKQFGGYVESLTSGGASLKKEVFEFFRDLGFSIQEGYGLTETSGCIALNPRRKVKAGSAGILLPEMVIRIDHPEKDKLGEIIVSGPAVFQGYFKDPDATREVLKDGWLFTGDLGSLDKDGYLFISGRKKDVIVLPTGKKVYPDEIEALYGQSDLIKQIAVIGVNRGQGEEVFACIVPNSDGGGLSRTVLEARIKEHLMKISTTLSPHKHISGYKFFDKLPSNSLTKVKKYELRKLIESESIVTSIVSEEIVSKDNNFERILSRLLRKYVKRPDQEIQYQSHLELDLGIDSLGRAELTASLKKTFNLNISDRELLALQTAGDIADLLKNHGSLKDVNQIGSLAEIDWSSILNQESPNIRQTVEKVFDSYPRVRKAFLRFFYGVFLKIARLTVTGLEQLPDSGPYILALNHESHLDNLFLACFLSSSAQKNLAVISKKEHFEHWFTRFFARLCHAVPVDRENVSAGDLQVASYLLKTGKILLVHPEGTRSSDGQLLPLKNGVALLALHHQCPIVPVFIEGAHEYWPKDSLLPKFRGNISVNIGECIDLKKFAASQQSGTLIQAADELTRILRDSLLGIKEKISRSQVSFLEIEEETIYTNRAK